MASFTMSIGLTAPAVSSRAASRGACSPFANRDQYPEPSPFARLVAPNGAYVTLPSRRRSGRPDDENARVPPRMSAERDVCVTGDDAGASSPRSSRVRRARPGRPPRAEGVKFQPLALRWKRKPASPRSPRAPRASRRHRALTVEMFPRLSIRSSGTRVSMRAPVVGRKVEKTVVAAVKDRAAPARYEAVILMKPGVEDSVRTAEVEKLKAMFMEGGATEFEVTDKGLVNNAYEIKGFADSHQYMIHTQCPRGTAKKVQNYLDEPVIGQEEVVLRYMFFKEK